MPALEEIIRKVGSKYHLRSKDGKKLLGRFDSKAEAESAERRAKRFSKEGESMIGLAKLEDGKVVLAEGGRLEITEAESLQRLTDDQLQTMRKAFVALRTKSRKKHSKFSDATAFSTPEGQQAFADIDYYNGLIRRIEFEMQDRYLPLN